MKYETTKQMLDSARRAAYAWTHAVGPEGAKGLAKAIRGDDPRLTNGCDFYPFQMDELVEQAGLGWPALMAGLTVRRAYAAVVGWGIVAEAIDPGIDLDNLFRLWSQGPESSAIRQIVLEVIEDTYGQ